MPGIGIAADSTTTSPLLTQTIVYKTSKAGQLYIVWYLDYWKTIPDSNYWPPNTFLKDGMAWSPMAGDRDSFSISISLPSKSNLCFMFWVPVDNEGDSTDGWDTYGDQTYTSNFNENKTLRIGDGALWMPEKRIQFNLFEYGSKILISALLLSGVLLLVFGKQLSFSKTGLLLGLIIGSLSMAALVRIQMNDLFKKDQLHVFGAIFHDLIWFTAIGVLFLIFLFLVRNYRRLKTILLSLFVFVLLFSVLYILLNIEIVKIIGRPVNYQWLYYSDFMTGTDAKHAVATNLSQHLVTNLMLLLLSIIVFSVASSFIPRTVIKRLNAPLAVLAAFVFCVAFYQSKAIPYEKSKIINPLTELITSSIISKNSSKLFTMKISDKTKRFIEQYHKQNYPNKVDSADIIKNVVLFVFESTPKEFVSIYDSTFNVTPNLKKWKGIASIYTNMYSHLPATVYSFGAINSGVYPLINHISLVASYPNNRISTLSGELNKKQWATSLFFAADLVYSNMGIYAKSHGFDVVEDNTSIQCTFKKFGNSSTFLDQLDDRCLSNRYFEWFDSVKAEKKFSMLWTTQTHYSYLARNEKKYTDENADLNRYLNALRESDEAFGMLMEGLEKRDALKNTLVVVTADHGQAFGTHNQIMHASKIYEENVNIPFIMYNPNLFNGSIKKDICGLIDIAPTITHTIGIERPTEWEGKSLFMNKTSDRTFFFAAFSEFLFGTRTGNWKYIYNAESDKEELYNLKTDPKELKNIASIHPEIAKNEFEMIAGWVQFHNNKMKPHIEKR